LSPGNAATAIKVLVMKSRWTRCVPLGTYVTTQVKEWDPQVSNNVSSRPVK
jgi:hypothetical protein